MDAIAGCSYCGHTEEIERTVTTGQQVGRCPRCGHSLRALGPLGSRLLATSPAQPKARGPLRERWPGKRS
jgi:hypothetical protein